jgi:hypothetical protein
MLSVIYKPFMLSVVMLSIVAPGKGPTLQLIRPLHHCGRKKGFITMTVDFQVANWPSKNIGKFNLDGKTGKVIHYTQMAWGGTTRAQCHKTFSSVIY